MGNEVIKKLFSSLDELDHSIQLARRALSVRVPYDQSLLQRIENYEEVLSKQRRLAERMCEYIVLGNWDEVNRHVKLINGLSSMIYADAKELTESLISVENEPEEERKVAN